MGKMKELAMEEQQRQVLGSSSDVGYEIDQLKKETDKQLDIIIQQLVGMRIEIVESIKTIDRINNKINYIIDNKNLGHEKTSE